MKDTILYIDDERGNLDTFWVVFHEEYELLLAKSAAEGYKLMERHEIKVAIVDQRMPQEDGIKFISNVKTKYPNVVYMILSGYADFDIA
ncbi:MAG: response regulator, partial [Bacteroidota bacterium]